MGDDLFDKLKEEGPISNKIIHEKEFCFRETPLKTYMTVIPSIIHSESSPVRVIESSVNKSDKRDNIIESAEAVEAIIPMNIGYDTDMDINLSTALSDMSNENKRPDHTKDKKYALKTLKVRIKRTPIKNHLSPLFKQFDNGLKNGPKNADEADSPMKTTLTKAQQKSFEPSIASETKPCVVRIRRLNLKKLQNELNDLSIKTHLNDTLEINKKVKRIHQKSPHNSRLKHKSKSDGKRSLNNLAKQVQSTGMNRRTNKQKNKTSSIKQHSQQLKKMYGKQWFNVRVRINRCNHPLLLTFESNARARMLQAKKAKNKSKNLRVTFMEQVEVFGDASDTDDDDTTTSKDVLSSAAKNSVHSSNEIQSYAQLIMPARLKKVQNGKYIDDIEFDPNDLGTSTPLQKRAKHKSLSPLKKDDGAPSPRKDKLKLSNEVWAKRKVLNEDEDEDDDCEYIVPNDLPQRHLSRANSVASMDNYADDFRVPQQNTTTKDSEVTRAPTNSSELNIKKSPTKTNTNINTEHIEENKQINESKMPEKEGPNDNSICSSFETAIGDQMVKLLNTTSDSSLHYVSPLTSSQTPMDLFDDVLSGSDVLSNQTQHINTSTTSEMNNINDTVNKISLGPNLDDISMSLFAEGIRTSNSATNAMDDGSSTELPVSVHVTADVHEQLFTAIS